MRSGETILAIDIGGTKIAATLVGPDGRAIHDLPDADADGRLVVPTPAREGATAVLAAAAGLGRRVLTLAAEGRHVDPDGSPGTDGVCAVGVGSAGVVDPRTGYVTHATDALPGWAGTDLAGELTRALALPAYALNDVHAHALGEARFGAGRGAASMLLVAVGTGIGGGYVQDGRPVFGTHAGAGNVGHIGVPEAEGLICPCGRTGHLEGLASGPGTLGAFRRAGGQADTGREVAALAAGDGPQADLARTTLTRSGWTLGRVLGGCSTCWTPS